jgi:hypothetical protein
MNTQQATEYAIKAIGWMRDEVTAYMAEEKAQTIERLQNRDFLGEYHRRLIALCLFVYSMYNGPGTFTNTVDAVEVLGVDTEFIFYSNRFKTYQTKETIKETLNIWKATKMAMK